jgi:hypothetical protein
MAVTTMRTTYTSLAAGVTSFAWHASGDRGDGLLVDVDTANQLWCDVADVLLWPTPVEPATAAARAASSHAMLAVVPRQPGSWLVLTFSVAPAHTTRAITHRAVVCAGDRSTLLTSIVEHYRAVVSERCRPYGVTSRSARPPGHA